MCSQQRNAPPRDNPSSTDLLPDSKERNSEHRTTAGNSLDGERRKGNRRIPNDPVITLNDAQSTALSGIDTQDGTSASCGRGRFWTPRS